MTMKIQHCVRTLRLKVKAEGYAWLNAAAIEVNQVWNFSNAASYKAARPFSGRPRWLSAFDLDKLTAGATECFARIGSDTIQRVNAELATRRKQFKRAKLRWRVSQGAKRSLGWVPFKAAQLKRNSKSVRFSGKAFRVFERELLEGAAWKAGCLCSRCGRGLVALFARMAKSVLDSRWGMLKTQLQYKGQQAGRSVFIVSEKNTTRTYSSCKALTGPAGLDMLVVRTWVCSACGDRHDRDVNAARNILSAGRLSPSVSGNEPSLAVAEPRQTYSLREAGTSALQAAA
jgi:Putative transposase DNA-binding domain